MPLNYVEITHEDTGEYIGLFRIIPSLTRKLATINEVTYELEHVLATLLNDVMFKYHQTSNHTTIYNIDYVLARQTTKHWRRGNVDFVRYFHYKWENENGLLGPLFSIPKPFDEPYEWTHDTRSYPWTIGLEKPSMTPTCEIRYGKNMREIEREIDPSNIVNRIYPMGYGEGVNQLDITKINGGVPYLENAASIAKYGLQAYVWVDRRFEDVESLKASGRALLDEWSVPKVTYKASAADLYELTGASIDKFDVGKVVRIVDPDLGTIDARIFSVKKPDLYGARGEIELEIGNKTENLSTTQDDLDRRQEINEVYAQGATNMLIYPYEDNVDSQNPAVIRFNLPDEMVRINKLELTYETSEFRAYSRAIEGGGAIVSSTSSGGAVVKSTSSGGGSTATSSSGGGTTATSSSGGGVAKSTASGGGTTQTSSGGGDHRHVMFQTGGGSGASGDFVSAVGANGATIILGPGTTGMTNISTLGASGNHSHNVSIPSHTHNFDVPNHSHNVTIQNHSHTVNIPNHTHEIDIPAHRHDITLPDHTHEIEHGIFKLSRRPSKVTIKVDGNTVPHSALTGNSIDLIPYLSVDSENRVNRGWHTIEITTDDLGRINAEVMAQFFMQSRGGVDA